MMVFLRALIFSSDATTQTQTAKMIQSYMATDSTDLQSLEDHVYTHGSPPHIRGADKLATIVGSPGATRLDAMENPKYYDKCLRNLFGMVIEVNARIRLQDLDTGAAKGAYDATQPGSSYAETSANEERAWIQHYSCAVCMATQGQRPTLTELNFYYQCVHPIRGIQKQSERFLKSCTEGAW